jgi:hypothetical protein
MFAVYAESRNAAVYAESRNAAKNIVNEAKKYH